jgi:hypothetical protein
MSPIDFPETNVLFGPPADLDPSQCLAVPGYAGKIKGGSLDGASVVVTCWQPSAEDLAKLNAGQPIFLSFIGGLPPHMACMDFQTATHPA